MRKKRTKEDIQKYFKEYYKKNKKLKSEQPGYTETRGVKKGTNSGAKTKLMSFSIEVDVCDSVRKLAKEKSFNMSEYVNYHIKDWIASQNL